MEIVNIRVDSRGIHGQVATTWVPYHNINRIMVIDDEACKDEMKKMALKMACPDSCKLSILPIEKAIERLSDNSNYVDEKILIIFTNVESVYKMSQLGYDFKSINLGNVSNKPNTKMIAKTVYLNDLEMEKMAQLEKRGVNFTYQMVPNDSLINISFL